MKGDENMQLISHEIKEQIPPLYATQEQTDPIAYVKLFMPDSNWTWYITEMSVDSDICFGYVVSPFENELGYFSLHEIQEVKGSLGLGVERDLSFTPTSFSKVKKSLDA